MTLTMRRKGADVRTVPLENRLQERRKDLPAHLADAVVKPGRRAGHGCPGGGASMGVQTGGIMGSAQRG